MNYFDLAFFAVLGGLCGFLFFRYMYERIRLRDPELTDMVMLGVTALLPLVAVFSAGRVYEIFKVSTVAQHMWLCRFTAFGLLFGGVFWLTAFKES